MRVSVLCPTYNSQRWITQTLEALVMQETSFPFEVLVRDDGSTDDTVEVLHTFVRQYPLILKLVLCPVNTYPAITPYEALRSLAKGDILAYCDGDDQWQDQLKLQKQVDLLDERPDAVAVHHDYVVRTWDDSHTNFQDHYVKTRRRIRRRKLVRGGYVPWCVLLHRAVPIAPIPIEIKKHIANQDRYFCSQLGRFGSAVKAPDVYPSLYNVHSGGHYSGLDSLERETKHATSLVYIAHLAQREKNFASAQAFRNDAAATMLLALGSDPQVRIRMTDLLYLLQRVMRRRLRVLLESISSSSKTPK